MLADYSPDSFYEALPSVQDDLGMLQASAVPDLNQDDYSDFPPAPDSSSQSQETTSKIENGLGFTVEQPRPPPLGSSRTSLSLLSGESHTNDVEPTPPVVIRDFAATAPVKRYKTKRARSSIRILPRPSSRRANSSVNKMVQRHSPSGNEASLSDSSLLSASPEATAHDGATPAEKIPSPTAEAHANEPDGVSPSDIPHLTDNQSHTFVEVAPGIDLVEVNPDTESDHQGTDTETGLTTDETDDDILPESAFDPLKFLTEIFASM